MPQKQTIKEAAISVVGVLLVVALLALMAITVPARQWTHNVDSDRNAGRLFKKESQNACSG